jgi:hypothetical protein
MPLQVTPPAILLRTTRERQQTRERAVDFRRSSLSRWRRILRAAHGYLVLSTNWPITERMRRTLGTKPNCICDNEHTVLPQPQSQIAKPGSANLNAAHEFGQLGSNSHWQVTVSEGSLMLGCGAVASPSHECSCRSRQASPCGIPTAAICRLGEPQAGTPPGR